MFATDCIDPAIKPLQLRQTVSEALDWCTEQHTTQAIVCEDDRLAGVIPEELLLDLDDTTPLGSHAALLQDLHLPEHTHIFDILKSTGLVHTYLLPVVDAERQLIGITSATAILDAWSKDAQLSGAGGIIVLELAPNDYSLAEIAKITESNHASILHCMLTAAPNPEKVRVSVKVNKNDLKDLQATFERFNYDVIAVIHQSEYELELQDRLDSLMKYLEV